MGRWDLLGVMLDKAAESGRSCNNCQTLAASEVDAASLDASHCTSNLSVNQTATHLFACLQPSLRELKSCEVRCGEETGVYSSADPEPKY